MFRMVIAQARSLIRQCDDIKRTAYALLSKNRTLQLLRMLPRIRPINALTILAEAGDHWRFAHHRQFLKFCGLDLARCQSGSFRGRTKLSKYGNARLRRTFWLATQVSPSVSGTIASVMSSGAMSPATVMILIPAAKR